MELYGMGGGGGVDWGRGGGGCHVSMWKNFLDKCKKGWVGQLLLTPPPLRNSKSYDKII